jgi:hypothetical protein
MEKESRQYKVLCPLINFQISNVLISRPTEMSHQQVMEFFKEREKQLVEGIELFEGIKIKRISKEDIGNLKSSIFSLPTETIISPNMFVLEKYIATKDNHKFQLHETMKHILLAMRLFMKGYVSGNITFYILVSERKPQFVSVEWAWEEGRRSEPLGFSYLLKLEEIPVLRKLAEKIHVKDFTTQRSLNLACKRFQRAYEEVDHEDQLIDFMIAFEALFLKGEKATPSSGQIVAVACSILLGKNNEEREEIKGFLTKAY